MLVTLVRSDMHYPETVVLGDRSVWVCHTCESDWPCPVEAVTGGEI